MTNRWAMALATTLPILAGPVVAHAADIAANQPPVAYQGGDVSNGVKIGYLDCTIAGGAGYVLGSAKQVDCVFQSTVGNGGTDHYTGAIRKLGIDLGFTTRSRLIWAVLAPTAGYHRGSLSGIYQGATAEATVGAGIGANILVGGTSGSIQLQTVSVTGQLGLNVAATGTSMTLNPVN